MSITDRLKKIFYLISIVMDSEHDGEKRNQILQLGYNCMVLVHLFGLISQTRYTKRNHKGIF